MVAQAATQAPLPVPNPDLILQELQLWLKAGCWIFLFPSCASNRVVPSRKEVSPSAICTSVAPARWMSVPPFQLIPSK